MELFLWDVVNDPTVCYFENLVSLYIPDQVALPLTGLRPRPGKGSIKPANIPIS